jgi:hypothetical protein
MPDPAPSCERPDRQLCASRRPVPMENKPVIEMAVSLPPLATRPTRLARKLRFRRVALGVAMLDVVVPPRLRVVVPDFPTGDALHE